MSKEEILEKLLRLFKHNGVNNFIIPDDAELLYHRDKRYYSLIQISSDKYKCRITWIIEGNCISINNMVFNHYVQDVIKPEKRNYQEWNDYVNKIKGMNILIDKI